jgi:hypothetical protein
MTGRRDGMLGAPLRTGLRREALGRRPPSRGAFAVAYRLLRPAASGAGGWTAALLGLGVFSHWLLDLLVHRPDLPLLPHGPYAGLGLWNQPAVAVPLELALYVGGSRHRRGRRDRDYSFSSRRS